MEFALLFLSGLLFTATCWWQFSAFTHLAKCSVQLVDAYLIQGKEDDRLPVVEKRTAALMKALFRLIFILVVATLLSGLVLWGGDQVLHTESVNEMSSLWGIISLSVGATAPLLLHSRQKSSYSPMAQLLHHLALDNYHLAYTLFKREVHKMKRAPKEEFIIITGLARAGTTSLLNHLIQVGPFASLNYANMPFVLSPNTWSRLYSPRSKKEVERSHGDGISIGLDSNEALEEYFFKVITDDAFIGKNSLTLHTLEESQYQDYLEYQSIVRQNNAEIYVAKNNNFLLRIASLRKLNASFRAVILFRDPMYHAASLLEKHKQFQVLQTEEPFVTTYMNWLGHHEFGTNHKPFSFGENDLPLEAYTPDSIDYWLAVWIRVYEYALSLEGERTYFVNYEDFCTDPQRILYCITEGIEGVQIPALSSHMNARKLEANGSPDLLVKAENLYERLKERKV